MILAIGTIIFLICSLSASYVYLDGTDTTFQTFWFGLGIFIGCFLTQCLWEAYKARWWKHHD